MKPLYGYYFKRKRLENNLTLNEVSEATEISISYLSMVENNDIQPSKRKLDKLTVFYKAKPTYFSIQTIEKSYILSFFDKIYYGQVTKEDIDQLNKLIATHQKSAYLGYLELMEWCYYAQKVVLKNKNLAIIADLLNKNIHSFPIEFCRFYYISCIWYYSRIKSKKQLENAQKKLKNIEYKNWDGLEKIAELGYLITNNDFFNTPETVNECKEIFKRTNNQNCLNHVLMYEAIYLSCIQDYNKALEKYAQLKNIYLKNKNNMNFAVVEHNMGEIYFSLKNYIVAADHFKAQLQFLPSVSSYFKIAYCFYALNDKKTAMKWLQKSKEATSNVYVENLLIQWLTTMIENPYSKKCINLLLKIEKKFNQLSEREDQAFILLAIIDYYFKEENLSQIKQYSIKYANINKTGGYCLSSD